jgi:hypothetical protein
MRSPLGATGDHHGPPSTAAIRRRFPSYVTKKTVKHPSGDKEIYRKAFSYRIYGRYVYLKRRQGSQLVRR